MEGSEQHNQGLPRLFRALRRRKWTVLLCLVLVVGATAALTFTQPKRYSATASLLFRNPGFDETLFGTQNSTQGTDPTREAATNLRLVSSELVAARAARAIGTSSASVQSKVTVAADGPSNIVTVSALDTDRDQATKLANVYAKQFIASRKEADQQKVRAALSSVQRRLLQLDPAQARSVNGQQLRTAAQQLTTLASVQTGNAELAQPAARPDGASSPRPTRNLALGIFLGALLGIGLALLRERLDRRLHAPEDVEGATGLPLFGAIALDSSLRGVESFNASRGSGAYEAVSLIRAKLRYYELGRGLRSLAITSAGSGEGKSTVAWTLGAVGPQAGLRVLVIEADLRRPVLVERLKVPLSPGLTSVLIGESNLADAVRAVHVPGMSGAADSFDVLPAGAIPPNPAELLESQRMIDLLKAAESAYDLVIIDTSPVGIVADGLAVLSEATATLLVARLEWTKREDAENLVDTLVQIGVKPIGVVANGAPEGRSYGYYSAKAPERPALEPAA